MGAQGGVAILSPRDRVFARLGEISRQAVWITSGENFSIKNIKFQAVICGNLE